VKAQAGERPVTLDTEDRAGIAKLATALQSAGYDAKRIRPMLRADSESLTPRPADVPIIVRLLPNGDPLATLLRLFLLSLPVPIADARAALSPLTIEHALRLGIVRRSPGGLESTVRLLPAGDLVIACDRSPESAPDLAADHVMGVASSSVFLASLTVRHPIERALDIGCGNGIQAVLAARHAQRVVACDVNPRALNFTLFNGSLNGVENIECRVGSFFEPVAGETFDLIVSNPPFVISPENRVVFRDSGLGGDAVTRQVVREAPAHLREGGLAFVLGSWGVREGEGWPDPLRPWVADLPCDVWALHHSSDVPLMYAASWNSPLQGRAAEYSAALDRWSEYLGGLGFASIAYGAFILRRRSGAPNWVRFDDLRGQREPASGDQIAELIAAQDYLARLHDDRQLLEARLTLVREHRLEQLLRAHDGGFEVQSATLRLESGLRFATSVDAFSAQLLSRLEGRTLAEAVRDAAAQFAADAIEYSEFESAALRLAKLGLALGFVRLVNATDGASVAPLGRMAGGGDGNGSGSDDITP
jgi:methylase of polypeptide subunit release factors